MFRCRYECNEGFTAPSTAVLRSSFNQNAVPFGIFGTSCIPCTTSCPQGYLTNPTGTCSTISDRTCTKVTGYCPGPPGQIPGAAQSQLRGMTPPSTFEGKRSWNANSVWPGDISGRYSPGNPIGFPQHRGSDGWVDTKGRMQDGRDRGWLTSTPPAWATSLVGDFFPLASCTGSIGYCTSYNGASCQQSSRALQRHTANNPGWTCTAVSRVESRYNKYSNPRVTYTTHWRGEWVKNDGLCCLGECQF
jgi:hypothetical protein